MPLSAKAGPFRVAIKTAEPMIFIDAFISIPFLAMRPAHPAAAFFVALFEYAVQSGEQDRSHAGQNPRIAAFNL